MNNNYNMSIIYNHIMELLKVPFSAIFLAKRNTGKSVLAEYVINKLLDEKKIDIVYIFSKTCMLGDNWRSINDKYKYEDMDFKKIANILKFQMQKVKSNTKKKKTDKTKPNFKNICLVFDDVIDSSNTGGKADFLNLINELFSRGRHFKISVILCNQYVKSIVSPTVRSNIDYLFLSCNTVEVLNYVYSLVIYNGNKQAFVDFINSMAVDYYFVMYNNLTNDKDRYYRIKADIEYNESKIGKNKY